MRRLLTLPLVALVLVALVATRASATLSGCFCNDQLANALLPNDPIPGVQYFASSVCMCYPSADTFTLQINGRALITSGNHNISLPMASCSGVVLYAQPQLAVLTYNATNYCSADSSSSSVSFCPWVCAAFAGTYNFLYDLPTGTRMIAFAPGPVEPPVSWGGLVVPIKLICNDTSCGDASGLVPPAPIPENVTVDVRAPPPRQLLALNTCYKRCLGAWRDERRCKRDCN